MKLRIHDNSVRFRLTRSEVDRLNAGETVEGTVRFAPAPAASFTYAVEASAQSAEVRATGADRQIRVILPAKLVRSWATTDQVSIEHTQPIGAGLSLSILVEKDFVCLHNPPQSQQGDQADYFPNPADPARH